MDSPDFRPHSGASFAADDLSPPPLERRQTQTFGGTPTQWPRPRRPGRGRRRLLVLLIAVLLAGLAIGELQYDLSTRVRSLFIEELGASPFPSLGASDPWLPLAEPAGTMTVLHTVRRGDNISSIAQNYGLTPESGRALSQSFAAIKEEADGTHPMQPGRVLTFSFTAEGKLEQLSTAMASGHQLTLIPKDDGSFETELIRPPTHPTEQIAFGTIESSFAAAASRTGVTYEVIDDLVDLFSDRVEFNKDFQRGDRFTLIYREQPKKKRRAKLGDETISSSSILAAALEIGGQHLVAARYVGSDGKARYFDEKGKLLGNAFLRYPLKFSRISSYFSTSRFHPVLKFSRPHNGVDFAAPVGTPVRTVADGVVQFAGRRGGSGIMVKIRHSQRYSSAYLHLSALGKGVKNGIHVSRGQVIGAVGMTGLATGPHLHFSFYDNDKYVDPLKIKLPMLDAEGAGTGINKEYLKRVLFTLEHYQTVSLKSFFGGEQNEVRAGP